MSVLAFKALSHGAEQIPDKFFEKIPGGYFCPPEKKNSKDGKKDSSRDRNDQRPKRSRRDESPQTDYTDRSGYDDSEYERERSSRGKDRNRRAKSEGRKNSPNRGRDYRSSDLDGEYSDHRDMARAEQGDPYFPPPPSSEYAPYNPQDYGNQAQSGDYRPSSAGQPYGYPAQPTTGYAAQPGYGQQHRSSTAARYTPGPGYAPSPVLNSVSVPAPPVGMNSPSFAAYNPAEYAGSAAYQNPPPLSRHRSNSNPPYPSYNPDQCVAAYDDNRASSRRDSTKPRREHRHRARSADTHASRKDDRNRENSRMAKVRDRFDSMDLRGEGLAAAVGGALAGGLAGRQLGKGKLTALAGAAAGAFGGKAISDRRSKSRGARRSPSRERSRSRSRRRHHDDRARSRDRDYSRSPPRAGLRARSKSIIDRFRSKSRGPPEEKEVIHIEKRRERPDRGYDRSRSRSLDRDRSRSRDRARGRDEEYDYFSSESEADGSPVTTRRRRRRSRRGGDY